MMAARSELRNYMESGMPVNEAVDAANHQLCIGNDAGMFVTCWVAELDYVTGELSYVNGGHNPPMLMHDNTWSWMTEVSGMPLGLFDGIPYSLHTLKLVKGDMLYTYTDGVTEAMSVTNELFGEDRLEAVLNKNKKMNPRSVGVAVRRALTDYTHDAEQSDDITMLILKYGVPPKSEAVMVLQASEEQIVHVRNFINAELDRRKAPKNVYTEIDRLAQELFMNACRRARSDAMPDGAKEVSIGFEYHQNPSLLNVTVADDGAPYNPLDEIAISSPDDLGGASGDDGQEASGTLSVIDEATYKREDKNNVVVFSKSW
jgi:anti-sigma regulatory factor (Ser/Thr protein kinase)